MSCLVLCSGCPITWEIEENRKAWDKSKEHLCKSAVLTFRNRTTFSRIELSVGHNFCARGAKKRAKQIKKSQKEWTVCKSCLVCGVVVSHSYCLLSMKSKKRIIEKVEQDQQVLRRKPLLFEEMKESCDEFISSLTDKTKVLHCSDLFMLCVCVCSWCSFLHSNIWACILFIWEQNSKS